MRVKEFKFREIVRPVMSDQSGGENVEVRREAGITRVHPHSHMHTHMCFTCTSIMTHVYRVSYMYFV